MSDRPAEAQKEARKEVRHAVVSFVWYKALPIGTRTDEELVEGIARSSDLSSSGLGMVIGRPLASGTWVFLELSLKVGRVSAVARVRHCRPVGDGLFRVGCTLDIMPPNDRQAVAMLLGG